MLLATNPCVASPCVASTSHAVASPSSTPIGAGSPFKMDGYDSKTTHSRRSNKDGGSDTFGTHKNSETRETTTLMIRNLPSHVTQTDLLHELNKLGLSKLYDFCYLPRDFNVVENKGSLVNHLVFFDSIDWCSFSYLFGLFMSISFPKRGWMSFNDQIASCEFLFAIDSRSLIDEEQHHTSAAPSKHLVTTTAGYAFINFVSPETARMLGAPSLCGCPWVGSWRPKNHLPQN